MKYLILLSLLLNGILVQAQIFNLDQSITRAVIVGVSEYQDEDIDDLQFAHKDALAFAAYLQSSAGGSLPASQIRLLINEEATTARIMAEVDWLIENSKAKDNAFIFYSGHGDVDINKKNKGYLLTHDSPAPGYEAGAYDIDDLKIAIDLLAGKDVYITLIADVCRAGNLIGSAISGPEATLSALMQKRQKVNKILSCNDDEKSLEGAEWGEGHGAFSYHLILGMYGFADLYSMAESFGSRDPRKEDHRIHLEEIGNYVRYKVKPETNPHSQTPQFSGKNTKYANPIGTVDTVILRKLKDSISHSLPTINVIDTRGVGDGMINDPVLLQKFKLFQKYISEKSLLTPTDSNAYDIYKEFIEIDSLESLFGIMERNLAAALQDEAQQAINAYMNNDIDELKGRLQNINKYDLYPKYLETAADLLGEYHYMYNNLKGKQYYFEGLLFRLKAQDIENRIQKDSLLNLALQKQKKAQGFEKKTAYISNEIGVIYKNLKNSKDAIKHFETAVKRAPLWGLPLANLSGVYFIDSLFDKSKDAAAKALKLAPNLPISHFMTALNYYRDKEYDEAMVFLNQTLKIDPEYSFAVNLKNIILNKLDLFYVLDPKVLQNLTTLPEEAPLPELIPVPTDSLAAAEEWFEKGVSEVTNEDKAEEAYRIAISLNPNHEQAHMNLAILYKQRGWMYYSLEHLESLTLIDPSNVLYHYNWAIESYNQDWYSSMMKGMDKVLELAPDNKAYLLEYAKLLISEACDSEINEKRKSIADKLKSINADTSLIVNLKLETGWCYFGDVEDYQEAEEAFKGVLNYDPHHVDAHQGLISSLAKLGKIEEALKYQRQLRAQENEGN